MTKAGKPLIAALALAVSLDIALTYLIFTLEASVEASAPIAFLMKKLGPETGLGVWLLLTGVIGPALCYRFWNKNMLGIGAIIKVAVVLALPIRLFAVCANIEEIIWIIKYT